MYENSLEKLKWGEFLFYIFFLLMNTATSMGLTSGHRIYRYIFAISLLMIIVKILLTEYTRQEYLGMLALAVLFCIAYQQNGEKTLLLTVLAIIGCKGVELRKLLKVTLACRISFLCITVMLAWIEFIPNQMLELPKNEDVYILYKYGYAHPNSLFANIFMIALITVVLYYHKVRLRHIFVLTGVMYGAYQITMCRTGWLLWLLLLCVLGGNKLLGKIGYRNKLYHLFPYIAPGIAAFSFGCIILYRSGFSLVYMLDSMLTGRINLMTSAFFAAPFSLLGIAPGDVSIMIDNCYINLYIRSGVIIFGLVLIVYYWLCRKMISMQNYPVILALGVLAVYGFMEQFPLNVAWNPFLLYAAYLLFPLHADKDTR